MSSEYVTRVVRVHLDEETDIADAIERGIKSLTQSESLSFQNTRVAIKPNLNSADPYPASSDSAFIRALATVLLRRGPKSLQIIESSMFRLKTRSVAAETGIADVASKLDIETVYLDEGNWVEKTIDGAKYLKKVHVGEALLEAERLVLAPCLKTHKYARFTGAMKLFVGAMRKRDRLLLHARNLEQKIPELASLFRPSLIVMDARKVFVTGGPFSGRIESPGVIIVGTDMLAVDVVGVRLLQEFKAENRLDMDVWEIPQIRRAVELGLGAASDEQIEVVDI